MSKRQLLLGLFLAILILSGLYNIACSKQNNGGGMPPAVVEAEPVKLESWQTEINAIGTLNSNQGVIIKPETSGRVTGVYFRSGDYVKANAPLVQLNPEILKAQLAAAQAQANLSDANYKRGLELFKRNVFAQADLDKFLSTYQADIANVNKAKAQLEEATIRAPFEGRVGLRMVNVGDYINAGQTVITGLDSIDPLRVDFKVPEVYIGQLAPGETVLVQSDAYPKQSFKGTIYALDSKIDAATRSVGVRAHLPNRDKKLYPGAFVDVTVQTGKPQPLPTVPEMALVVEADGSYVYRVIKNKAVKTKVIAGARKPGKVAILTGLNKGDLIITAGALKVSDGAPVMIGK